MFTILRSPRHKWKRRFALGSLLFLGVILFLPRIIGNSFLLPYLIRQASKDLNGTVQVGSASLGWFRHVELQDITITDTQGQTIATLPKVQLTRSLFGLMQSPNQLGELSIEDATVHVVCSESSSNIETLLTKILQPKEPSSTAKNPELNVQCSRLHLIIKEEKSSQEWRFDPLDFSLQMKGDEAIQIQIDSTIASTDHPGMFHLDATIDDGINGTCKASEFPFAMIQPFLRRGDPTAHLDGQGDVAVTFFWKDENGAPHLNIAGEIIARDLRYAGQSLGTDQLTLKQVQLPCQFQMNDKQILFQKLNLICDVGTVRLQGAIPLENDLLTSLEQPGTELFVDVDLVKLTKLLPNTLQMQKDLNLTAGKFQADIQSVRKQDRIVWQGKIATSDLQALRQGQPISWKDPVSIDFAFQHVPNNLPIVDRLSCRSDFLDLNVTGDASKTDLRASCNLHLLGDHLRQFVQMESTQFSGIGQAEWTIRKGAKDAITCTGKGTLNKPEIVLGSKVWKEDQITFEFAGTGSSQKESLQIQQASLGMRIGPDQLSAVLTEPLQNVSSHPTFAAQVQLQGNLDRWKNRLAPWVEPFQMMQMAGTMLWNVNLQYTADQLTMKEVRGQVKDFQFRGMGIELREPSIEIRTLGTVSLVNAHVKCKESLFTSRTGTVQLAKFDLGIDSKEGLMIDGRGTLQADLVRLQQAFTFTPIQAEESVNGLLSGPIKISTNKGQLQIDLDLNGQNVTYGNPTKPLWKEQRIDLLCRANIDSKLENLQLEQVRLSGKGLNVLASGELTDLHRSQNLSCKGELDYDLESLQPQLQRQLGSSFRATGKERRSFQIQGPLGSASNTNITLGPPTTLTSRPNNKNVVTPTSTLTQLQGDIQLGWQTVRYLGCDIGKAELKGNLSGGALRFQPITASVNQGRFLLQPSIEVFPGPMTMYLPKGTVIDRGKITKEMCANGLAYIAPILDDVAEAEGEVSIQLNGAKVPFGDIQKANIPGSLILHNVKVGPGALVKELAVLLKEPKGFQLAKDSTVPFNMANGRIYHSNLELRFPDLTIRSNGSVGLDSSLDLTLEMPIPPKWLGNKPLTGALAKQTIRLPMNGTLAKPKLNQDALQDAFRRFAKETARDVLIDQLEKGLQKALPQKK